MLCPEIWNFPPPKVVTSYKKSVNLETVTKTVEQNNFYKSTIITCPDEMNTPQHIADILLEDSDYYKIYNCPLIELLEPIFIQNFVKAGKLYCLSSDTNCIINNCVSITPNGLLTLHILDSVFQTLGVEGNKCLHNYYQIDIDLINLKNVDRIRMALNKLETFNLYLSWEPETAEICPSSIAKYFSDKKIQVTCHSLEVKQVTPDIRQIPTLKDSQIEEIVEWVGMIAHKADLYPTEGYVSLYSEPECTSPIQSTRISLLIVKGFLTPNLISHVCEAFSKYVVSRNLNNYWSSMSIQSNENCLWQWSVNSPRIFQAQNSSCNIFFSGDECTIYSIGQLKYS